LKRNIISIIALVVCWTVFACIAPWYTFFGNGTTVQAVELQQEGIIKLPPPPEERKPAGGAVNTLQELKEHITHICDHCSAGNYYIWYARNSESDLAAIDSLTSSVHSTYGQVRYCATVPIGDNIFIAIKTEKTLQHELSKMFNDPMYVTEDEVAAEVFPVVEETIYRYVDENMTDLQKVEAIYGYLTSNYTFDDSYTIYFAREMLLEGTGVCRAFAETFKLYMDLLGIECIIQSDSGSTEEEEGHCWNRVRINGEWLNMDAAWDAEWYDVMGDDYIYFGMDDETFKYSHEWIKI
jgi:hypothetical protein